MPAKEKGQAGRARKIDGRTVSADEYNAIIQARRAFLERTKSDRRAPRPAVAPIRRATASELSPVGGSRIPPSWRRPVSLITKHPRILPVSVAEYNDIIAKRLASRHSVPIPVPPNPPQQNAVSPASSTTLTASPLGSRRSSASPRSSSQPSHAPDSLLLAADAVARAHHANLPRVNMLLAAADALAAPGGRASQKHTPRKSARKANRRARKRAR